MLPWTCPDELVNMLIGDVAVSLGNLAKAVEHKLTCRQNRTYPDFNYLIGLKVKSTIKYAPKISSELIKITYGRKCKQHNHTMNR